MSRLLCKVGMYMFVVAVLFFLILAVRSCVLFRNPPHFEGSRLEVRDQRIAYEDRRLLAMGLWILLAFISFFMCFVFKAEDEEREKKIKEEARRAQRQQFDEFYDQGSRH